MSEADVVLIGERDAPAAARLLRGAAALKGVKPLAGDPAGGWGVSHRTDKDAPILLAGPEVSIGLIAGLDLIETLFPTPTLFPNGNRGMPLALTSWAMAAARGSAPDAAALVARQLDDGRPFLQGAAPGLADLQADAALLETPDQETTTAIRAWRARLEDQLAVMADKGPASADRAPVVKGDDLVRIDLVEDSGSGRRLWTSAYRPE